MNNQYTHEIIPGILEKDWREIERKIQVVRTFSQKIHIDFIDGKFANNQTFFEFSSFSKYAKELYLEAHLMVEEPINYLDNLSKAGFKKFIGHIEKMNSQEDFIAKAEGLGEVGVALNLETPIEKISSSFEDLDVVLLMSIPVGFSGQKFDESSLQKIKDLRSKTTIPIEVDGGINEQTIVQCKEAGANIFISTSFTSDSDNPKEQYERLQKNLY